MENEIEGRKEGKWRKKSVKEKNVRIEERNGEKHSRKMKEEIEKEMKKEIEEIMYKKERKEKERK